MLCPQLAEEITKKRSEGEEMDRIRTELYLEEQEELERQKERVCHHTKLLVYTVEPPNIGHGANSFVPCI